MNIVHMWKVCTLSHNNKFSLCKKRERTRVLKQEDLSKNQPNLCVVLILFQPTAEFEFTTLHEWLDSLFVESHEQLPESSKELKEEREPTQALQHEEVSEARSKICNLPKVLGLSPVL